MAWPGAEKTKEPVVHKKPIIAEVPSVPKAPQKDSLSTPRFDDAVRPAPSPGITFAGFPKPLLPDADLSEMTLSQILDQKVDLTNPAARAEKARQLMLVSEARQKAAWARAEKLGLPIRGRNPGGGLFELQDFEDDRPVYHSDETANAAVATAVNELRADPVYAGINGAGVNVGLWDGGQPRRDHRALQHGFLGRRARWMDASRSLISDHATHVAGILAGQNFAISGGGFGAPDIQVPAGMASEAYLLCYNFTQAIAEMSIVAPLAALHASNVVSLSNHSYGNETGWHLDGNSRWHGLALCDVVTARAQVQALRAERRGYSRVGLRERCARGRTPVDYRDARRGRVYSAADKHHGGAVARHGDCISDARCALMVCRNETPCQPNSAEVPSVDSSKN